MITYPLTVYNLNYPNMIKIISQTTTTLTQLRQLQPILLINNSYKMTVGQSYAYSFSTSNGPDGDKKYK